jgi:feruloyl esterase
MLRSAGFVPAFLFASVAAAATPCSTAAIQAISPQGTTISSAASTPAPLPHCRIDGYVTTNDPGPNQVNFRLQLPDTGWTGRYYFIGMGGSAGSVPSDSQIPAGNPLLKGFAVAGTDTGRQGSAGDWDFLGQSKAKALDHIDRGAHVTAVATQHITKAYYGRTTKIYRYFSGCSGGGRMATMAIERHPEDFDGLLLGAPGGRSSASMLKFIQASQQMMREPGAWVSPAKLQMVDQKVTAACDAADGAVDGIVADHTLCKFDVATLKCPSGDAAQCLTEPEIKSIKAILEGPRTPKGEQLAQGMPITNMSVWGQFTGLGPPPWPMLLNRENMMKGSAGYTISSSLARAYFGPDYDIKNFDFNNQRDIDAWWAAAQRTGYGIPYSADLRGFEKSGGKVILWNGVSDPCCGDLELQKYYLDAGKSIGGDMKRLETFARLYAIPGMGHCGSGTGPMDAPDQFLEKMIAWVEKGEAPQSVVAHRGASAKLAFADPTTGQVSGVLIPPTVGSTRDFLLCPYPLVATFNSAMAKQDGAVDAAVNWSCKATRRGKRET